MEKYNEIHTDIILGFDIYPVNVFRTSVLPLCYDIMRSKEYTARYALQSVSLIMITV